MPAKWSVYDCMKHINWTKTRDVCIMRAHITFMNMYYQFMLCNFQYNFVFIIFRYKISVEICILIKRSPNIKQIKTTIKNKSSIYSKHILQKDASFDVQHRIRENMLNQYFISFWNSSSFINPILSYCSFLCHIFWPGGLNLYKPKLLLLWQCNI